MRLRTLALAVLMAVVPAGCGRPEAAGAPASPAAQAAPTLEPTAQPTSAPTIAPTSAPTSVPSVAPAIATPVSTVALAMGDTSLPVVVTPVVTRTMPITIGAALLDAELATTPEQREYGLMGRMSMPADHGMLFVFPQAEALTFWMKDTPLPLSIAFVDTQKRILNIADMQPFDDRTFHQSEGMAMYALEVNQGWFAEHGIRAGDTLSFVLPPDVVVR